MAERTPKEKLRPDWWLLIAMLLLVAIGVIMVFSASQYAASYDFNDTYYYLKRQLRFAALGLIGLFLAYKVNFRAYIKLTYPAYLVVLVLLVFMVLSTNIETVGGAQRWLTIGGFTFQPSEIAKIVLPMALARWLTDNRQNVASFKRGFLPSAGLTLLTAGLIFLQKDLSSAMVVGAVGFIMMYCAGIRARYLGGTLGLGLVGIGAAILFEPYRLQRVYSWLDPWSDALGDGYQTVQSLLALGSGGLTGVGLGSGGSKWYYLPARHTDFIYSVLGEELGFIGGLVVILIMVFLIWRGIMVAVRVRNFYASMLAMGLISSLTVQTLINLGVVTGLFPVTGVTLPFLSYGGTSLVVSMIMVGMLMNISRYVDKT